MVGEMISASKVYSGLGADIVMESITLRTPSWPVKIFVN
jgi:hypothetical protein